MPNFEMGGTGVESTSPSERLKQMTTERDRLVGERDRSFPEMAPLFKALKDKDRELNDVLALVTEAKTQNSIKDVTDVASEFAVEQIPGVKALRRARNILVRVLIAGTSATMQWRPYEPTEMEDVKKAAADYLEMRKLAGREGERKIVEAQADLVQAESDLNRAVSEMPLERQAELLQIQAEVSRAEGQLAKIRAEMWG